ncbi:hypothetical protein, partial [Rubrivivax gelatinosus]|nr:hypothetical protein [Rubrivivax gelatinosus]
MTDLLAAVFDSGSRLYRLQGDGPLAELHVESWALREDLSEPFTLQLSALSTRFDLDLDGMLAQRLDLLSVLADGREQLRSGIVTAADACDGDGG